MDWLQGPSLQTPTLDQRFSKHSPNSNSIIWELIRNATSWAPSPTYRVRSCGSETQESFVFTIWLTSVCRLIYALSTSTKGSGLW